MKSLCLLSIPLALQLIANPSSTIERQELSEQSLHTTDGPAYRYIHIGARRNEAQGIGYKDSYTTVEGFAIFDQIDDSFMPFIDLRGHVFDNGKLAGNVGIGERTLLSSIDHILSTYLYYDIRRDRHHLTVHQLSPGIELLGRRMEYRLNGYFPVGSHKSRTYGYAFDQFDGHQIILKAKQQRALTGMDSEVGVHITQSTKYDVFAGAGPYYFTGSRQSGWGGKGRLMGRYKDLISLEVVYSYDSLFRSNVSGSISFNLPLGRKHKRADKNYSQSTHLLLSRAAFSPSRLEIPVIKKHHKKKVAVNPVTQAPWHAWFVNNTSHSLGTFESPFSLLAQAQAASRPYDLIYVFSGDGTSAGMEDGITLQNGQTLWGSGISQLLTTTHGKIQIPAFTTTAPLLTNGGGTVITLANGNTVSGFNILVTQEWASGIGGSDNQGVVIENNTISGAVNHYGVFLNRVYGNIKIRNNYLNCTAENTPLEGIRLPSSMEMSTTGDISNNTISGYDVGIAWGAVGWDTGSNGPFAPINITVFGNTITNFLSKGMGYYAGVPGSSCSIIRNTILNTIGATQSEGILCQGAVFDQISTVSNSVTIDQNYIETTTQNSANGLVLSTDVENGATLKAFVTNNRVINSPSNPDSIGIMASFINGNNNTLCLNLFNNTVVARGSTKGFAISANINEGNAINLVESGNTGPIGIENGNLVAHSSCGHD